jgi:NAD(P)-dependent dehydrogenase (short-subunit alcohol dehydrogenase family)
MQVQRGTRRLRRLGQVVERLAARGDHVVLVDRPENADAADERIVRHAATARGSDDQLDRLIHRLRGRRAKVGSRRRMRSGVFSAMMS